MKIFNKVFMIILLSASVLGANIQQQIAFENSIMNLPSLYSLININNVYFSPYLLKIKDNYSTEIYQDEFKKIQKLYKLTNNKYEKILYLYQALLMLYKNGDYKDVQSFSRSLRSLDLSDIVLLLSNDISKLSDSLKKNAEEYTQISKDLLDKQIQLKNRMKFFKSFRSVDDQTIVDLFDLYIYAFQFEDAKKMIKQLDKVYFKDPEKYEEMEFKLDTFMRYFGDMNIQNRGLTFLINKNYPDPEKVFNINKPDISFILAYRNEISQSKDDYQKRLIERVKIMEDLLPYLYLTEQSSRFKNMYEKVIFVTNNTPETLEVIHTNYKINELKKIYKEVLSQTIYNCYYELLNNTNISIAKELLVDIKNFSPTTYINYSLSIDKE